MFVAVAAMAFVSCQKEENAPVNETKSATLTLQATVADTKTYIEENAVLWGTGEYVQLYFNDGKKEQFVKSNDEHADEWNESDQAMFAFDIEYTQADSYVLGGVYPASATDGISNANAASFKLALPSVQNATVSSYDPAAFIMIMKPATVADADFDKTGHIAFFRRAVALNKLTLKGVKEAINSVSITVDGKDLAGRRYFDLTTGEGGDVYYGQTGTITVNGSYASGDIDVWFTSWGAEITEGETLKVVLKSDTKTYTKTITARADGIKFVEGDLNKLAIDMSSVTGVISAQSLPFEKDFSDKTGTTGLTELEGFTLSGSVYNAPGAIRLAKSSGSGTVTTESLDLSDEFHVIVDAAGWDSDEVVMTVSAGEQTNELTLSTYGASSVPGDFVSYVINFEPVGENATVSFTAASGKRVYIQKIQVKAGRAVIPSVLSAETPETMPASGGAGSFAYTLANPKDGQELTATTEADWITDIKVNEGTVSYTVNANSLEEPREATITLKYEGVDDVRVTVAQAGYVDPNQIHKVSVAEFSALTGTETATYELTGVVSEIYQEYNPTYDNISFYIEDETGKVLIFRMDCADDASLASIKAGDKVTVQGKPILYNGDIQMAAGGVCTSHIAACDAPVINCEDNIVTITAETGATIYYTTDGNDPTETSDAYSASTTIEVTEANSPMTVKAIAVADGKVASTVVSKTCTYVDPNADEIALGDAYTASYFGVYITMGTSFTISDVAWTVKAEGGTAVNAGDSTKGKQFGTKNAPCTKLEFTGVGYKGGIKSVKINTSCASNSGPVISSVTVGGVQMDAPADVALTKGTNKEFEFTSSTALTGDVVVTWTSSAKAGIYVKSIAINN